LVVVEQVPQMHQALMGQTLLLQVWQMLLVVAVAVGIVT
jgi:hypothetical protein